jgi:hypothetical protein
MMMHSMMLVGVVLHVTLFLTLAFFVLFAAQKADGLVKLLGNVIGVWLLILAVLVIVGCVTAPMFGGRPFGLPMATHMEVRVTRDNQTVTAAPPANMQQPSPGSTASHP